MPSRRISAIVPAGGQIANLLAGDSLEFPGRPSEVEVAMTVVAAGAGEIEVDVQFGSDLVLDRGTIAAEDAAGQGPKLPDNLVVSDVSASADRIIIRPFNVGATDRLVTAFIRINPA